MNRNMDIFFDVLCHRFHASASSEADGKMVTAATLELSDT
jgi:hypothetical protein